MRYVCVLLEHHRCTACRYEKIAHYQTQASREGRIKSATYKHQIPVGEDLEGGEVCPG